MAITKADVEGRITVLLARIAKISEANRREHALLSFGEEFNQIVDLAIEYKPSRSYPEKVDVDPPWGGLPGRTWASFEQIEEYLHNLQQAL